MTVSKTLTHWYSINKRNLPWRQTIDPYQIWLSEIILQQTQIKQGLPYYEAFVRTFPTVFDLANAAESDILKLWQGLGYYSRARNLHTTAKHVANELNGIFPNSYMDLLKLKGIGDYTASAISSICFNEPCAVVDGNVYRFLSRYYGIKTPINSTKGIKEFKNLAQELIDHKDPSEFNQAIMEFGSVQCKPKNPNCDICPVQNSCVAFKENSINDLPVKLNKTKITKKHFNFLVFISEDDKTILEKREGKGIWQNLYQFPLIETEQSANYKDINKRIVKLANIHKGSYSMSLYNKNEIIHKLSHQHLYTKFWIVESERIAVDCILSKDITNFPVPVLIENFIESFNF